MPSNRAGCRGNVIGASPLSRITSRERPGFATAPRAALGVKSPPSALEAHLGYWLRLVSNHVSHGFRLKVEKRGVTVAEWVVLRKLMDIGPSAPSHIAQALGMTRGAISKLDDRLADKGLIEIGASESDGREVAVDDGDLEVVIAESFYEGDSGAGEELRRLLCLAHLEEETRERTEVGRQREGVGQPLTDGDASTGPRHSRGGIAAGVSQPAQVVAHGGEQRLVTGRLGGGERPPVEGFGLDEFARVLQRDGQVLRHRRSRSGFAEQVLRQREGAALHRPRA